MSKSVRRKKQFYSVAGMFFISVMVEGSALASSFSVALMEASRACLIC